MSIQPGLLDDDSAPQNSSPDDGADFFRVVPQFPPFSHIANGDLFSLSLTNNTATLTHGLHRFPAKYIPQVPRWVLQEFGNRDGVVLDPFCGSGTTLVEALHYCHHSIGIDCDPLASMIARAKTIGLPSARLHQLTHRLRDTWTAPACRVTAPMPGVINFTHWFSERTWAYLSSLLTAIGDLDCDHDERRFFLTVFSSILRRVSNADDQTQKTYVSGTLKKLPPEVPSTFWKALQRALHGLAQLEQFRLPLAEARVLQGDSTDMQLPDLSVDLIVTSPPYLDSVDYMYNFMLEYFWLGPLLGVTNRAAFNHMRRGSVGAKNPLERTTLRLPSSLRDLLSEDDILPARLPATLSYCHSMARHFRSAFRVLKPNARYVLVIGNSHTKKGALPIHDSLIRLAVDAGFTFQKAFAYRIRRHYMKFPRKGKGGIITMDWIVVLAKSPSRASYPDRLPLPAFTLPDDAVAN